MFSHVTLGANDIAATKSFYDAVLGTLGVPEGWIDERGRLIYAHDGGGLTCHVEQRVERYPGRDRRQCRYRAAPLVCAYA